jgi:hypothetical protein
MNTIQLNLINYSPVFLLIIFTFGAYQNLTFMQFGFFLLSFICFFLLNFNEKTEIMSDFFANNMKL